MKKLFLASISLAVFSLVSCEEMEPLSVSPTELHMWPDQTEFLYTNKKNVTFTAEDDFYVSVSSDGVVKAKKLEGQTLSFQMEKANKQLR